MTVAERLRISCDRCPWSIEDEPDVAREARSEHAYAHTRDGKQTTFTETTVEAEEPTSLSDDTHTEAGQPVTTLAEPEAPVAEGKTVTQIAAEERAHYLAQPITVRCADCLWEHTAISSTARLEWAKHRRDTHGDDQIANVERGLNAAKQPRKPGSGILVGTKTLAENIAGARAAGADGSRVYSDPAAESNGVQIEEEPVAIPAVLPCKTEGCDRPRQDRAGPYGGLCATHKTEKQAARRAAKTGPATAKAPAAAREPVPKPNRPAGGASREPVESPRSLADIETDFQEQQALVADHERAIETAKLQIEVADGRIDELLDEARARIETMAHPFAGSPA